MDVSLGFSPCPNDTFIFHGIAAGQLPLPGVKINVCLHDVQTLNEMAFRQVLDVTKLSFYTWLKVRHNYRLLSSGAALGYGCGPVVVAAKEIIADEIPHCRIALPGEWTTAHLLFQLWVFQLWAPHAGKRIFTPYHRIFETLKSGRADCGVIIHESRFTFEQLGFKAIADLGAWWEAQTALPIPLGCIAVHKRIARDLARNLETRIRQSIDAARAHPGQALPYIRTHAQEITPEVLQAHIDTFVNDFSLDLGPQGRAAVTELEKRARSAGIIP
jgi:1,4-dihydroxy-6-naphthoate synthase